MLAFEDRAVTAFDRSLELLHPEMLRAEGFMAGWLGKGRGTVARLAAVLALLDWTANRPGNAPPPTVITTQHLCAAWDLWERYYRPHAQAVFDRAGPADGDRQGKHKARQHARRVIGWIRARGIKEISREEVRREALSQRVNAAGADEVILALEGAGVLREVEDDEEDYPRPRPPGAALAGQSGAAPRNPLRKLRKVPASPAQLGRCRRHTTPALSEVEGTEGSEAPGRVPPQNRLRKLRKSKPRLTRRKREKQAGPNDQASRRSADLQRVRIIRSRARGHERTWRSALPDESWSSGPRAPVLSEAEGSRSLGFMSERDARGPEEHEKTRHWSGAPPAKMGARIAENGV